MIRSVWCCAPLLGALLLGALLFPAAAQAERYVVQTPAGPKIAHTRALPVVLHRVSPPFWGRHIYRPRSR